LKMVKVEKFFRAKFTVSVTYIYFNSVANMNFSLKGRVFTLKSGKCSLLINV